MLALPSIYHFDMSNLTEGRCLLVGYCRVLTLRTDQKQQLLAAKEAELADLMPKDNKPKTVEITIEGEVYIGKFLELRWTTLFVCLCFSALRH
jgi:hypothetical protein